MIHPAMLLRPEARLVSLVAALLMMSATGAWAANPLQGYYFGTTSGACEDGEFALAIREDYSGIVMFYDRFDREGGFSTEIEVETDGSFTFLDIDGDGTNVTGQISGSDIGGTIDEDQCNMGSFVGEKACDEDLIDRPGFYGGDASGTVDVPGEGADEVFGGFHVLVGPGGQSFGYLSLYAPNFDESADDGGTLSTSDTGIVSGTLLDDAVVAGLINLDTGNGSGTTEFTGLIQDTGFTGTISTSWDTSLIGETILCPEPGASVMAVTSLIALAWRRRSESRRPRGREANLPSR